MFQEIENKIKTYLQDKYGVKSPVIEFLPSKDAEHGDYSTNCALKYAKECKMTSFELASKIVGLLVDEKGLKIELSKNGFINFRFSDVYLSRFVSDISKSIDLKDTDNSSKKILIEYSSPNIAKPFTVGHLRSTVIGDSLARIYKELGFDVITDNHLGDYGTQFGKLIYALFHFGSIMDAQKSEEPIKYLVDLYIKFHKEAEQDENMNEEARGWFLKLEKGDSEAREIWQICVDISMKEFNRIYRELGILDFTTLYGESFYSDKMESMLQALENKKLLTEDRGAKLVYFENNKYPPLMIVKKDGASLYATRDIATDKFRIDTYGKDLQMAIVVGTEQSLYFEQLAYVEVLLGFAKPGQRYHVKNGLFRLKSGKMSTRKGNVLWLDDILKESYRRSEALLHSKTDIKSLNEKERQNVIKCVAIGSIKWNDLKREPHKDVIFDWNEVLNMTGNSAPYIQYTYSRCMSLISKSTIYQSHCDEAILPTMNDLERQIIVSLVEFPEVIKRSASEFSPHYICHYLFDLCQLFNNYYAKYRIIGEKDEVFRIKIVYAISNVLKKGLYLLGIEVMERM